MSEQVFPSWWGPKGGDPIQCRSAQEIGQGWVEHRGHYDVQIGQWVPAPAAAPPPAAAKGRKWLGLTGKSRVALARIARAEGIGYPRRARRADILAAIKAKRAAGESPVLCRKSTRAISSDPFGGDDADDNPSLI